VGNAREKDIAVKGLANKTVKRPKHQTIKSRIATDYQNTHLKCTEKVDRGDSR